MRCDYLFFHEEVPIYGSEAGFELVNGEKFIKYFFLFEDFFVRIIVL